MAWLTIKKHKILTAVLVAAAACFCAGQLAAQTLPDDNETALMIIPGASDLTPEKVEALLLESPLSQDDIDAFVRIVSAPEDEAAFEGIVKNSGFSEMRMDYVFMKITLGLMVIEGNEKARAMAGSDIPEALYPTSEEAELISRNSLVLFKVFE